MDKLKFMTWYTRTIITALVLTLFFPVVWAYARWIVHGTLILALIVIGVPAMILYVHGTRR